MELRQLRYFIAVAEERSFRRASQRLHIAQPALSQQIAKLEKQLGARLLVRTTRMVELTESGTALLVEGKRILAGVRHAVASVEHAAQGELGTLRIGFVSSAALEIMPSAVRLMRQRWPELRLELTEAATDVQLDALSDGQLDVGVARDVGQIPDVDVRFLARERLIVAVPEVNSLARHTSVGVADLANESFLTLPASQVSRLQEHVYALCLRAGFRMSVVQEAVQFPTLLGLVAANCGITIVPAALRALQLPGLRYLDLTDSEAYSTISAISRNDSVPRPMVQRFLDSAVAACSRVNHTELTPRHELS